MRLFVAIAMPEETVRAIGPLQEAIPFGRIVPEENLHLTLAFLDERRSEEAEALHEALEGVGPGPVEVAFGGWRCSIPPDRKTRCWRSWPRPRLPPCSNR